MTDDQDQARWSVAEWHGKMLLDRNGEKIYEIFSTSVEINDKKASADMFMLPSSIKLLKPE